VKIEGKADIEKIEYSQGKTVSGPLPSSEEFAGYEQTLPGAANRILKLMEEETVHRHKIEDKVVDESLKISRRGQNIGLIVLLASAVLLGISIIYKQPIGSIAPAILALTALVSVFVGKK
jgi:uncharacterized membrane protein